MTDRLTDAELDWLADLFGHREDIPALVAEVREHRAARTLTAYEAQRVRWATSTPPDPFGLVAIIDRITEETDRD